MTTTNAVRNGKSAGCTAILTYPLPTAIDSTSVLIQVRGRNLWTTSRVIGDRFDRRHGNVIRAIENLECSIEFHRLNFETVEYIDEGGKSRKSYDISRDGFSLLAMGFTGKHAAQWKEKFIEAFGKMESELLRIANRRSDPALRIASSEKCAAATLMTDCLVDVRKTLGKETKPHHFSNEHSLCNWVLTGHYGHFDDNSLDRLEFRRLTNIRRRNAVLIVSGLSYAARKTALRESFPLLQLDHAHD